MGMKSDIPRLVWQFKPTNAPFIIHMADIPAKMPGQMKTIQLFRENKKGVNPLFILKWIYEIYNYINHMTKGGTMI